MDKIINEATPYFIHHFPLVMLGFAVLVTLLTTAKKFSIRISGNLFLYCVSFVGVWGFISHIYLRQNLNHVQLDYVVGLIYLSFAINGFFASFNSTSIGYKLATTSILSIFSWGVIIIEYYFKLNIDNLNSGSLFWTNIFIPLLLWLVLIGSRDHDDRSV